MLDMMTLGSRIRTLRREKGLTQNDFADKLHVSFQAISNWERGIATPDLDNLIQIANFFGVLVDDLLRAQSKEMFLGVDGGGTKTEFVVVSRDGHVLKQFVLGTSNPNDVGFEHSFTLIRDGIHTALLEFPSICAVFCGMSGIGVGTNRAKMYEMLKKAYPSLTFSIKSDSANLFAMDDRADMAVISGTGSVVFVKEGDELTRIGGWGHLFDTAGSAYDIGRDGVRVALAEEDAQEEASSLSCLLREHLGCERIWDAIPTLYSKGKPFIASLARIVFEAYRMGDENARQILTNCAKRLAELLNSGIETYDARPRAIASGGMFTHYADILLPLIQKYTSCEIVLCDLPPIFGACRLACRLMRTESEDFYQNFKETYRG